MPWCSECDAKILGTGYVGSGKCEPCYRKRCPDVINPAVKVAAAKRIDTDGTCPTCGQRVRPLTNAERQRRYRERKRMGK